MKTVTQNNQILALLQQRKDRGVNSFERLGKGIFAAQLPRCISDLRKQGHVIVVSLPLRDRSVNYFLLEGSLIRPANSKPLKIEPERANLASNRITYYKDANGIDYAKFL